MSLKTETYQDEIQFFGVSGRSVCRFKTKHHDLKPKSLAQVKNC